MTVIDGFRPVKEVSADSRGRVAAGHQGERYAVSEHPDGSVLLTPLASIPKRELPVWEDDKLRASLFRGLADAAEGRVKRMGWVTADE